MMTKPRVAVVADFLEEGWPSMNLVGEQLVSAQNALGSAQGSSLETAAVAHFSCRLIRPTMRRRLSRPGQDTGRAYTLDRLVGRFYDYPRHLRKLQSHFDLFHLADHSYSQLVHALPAGRTVVTCHDLDTFRCLWDPAREWRNPLFRAMTRRILSGMQKAAHVSCVSRATRDELLARRLLHPERVSVAHLGIAPSLLEPIDADAEKSIEQLLADNRASAQEIRLLHVGSTIARKRIDVVLEVFGALRRTEPRAILYRLGGPFTAPQMAQAESLGAAKHIRVLPSISVKQLAVLYRQVALVLQPSDAEGFGLPVVEAMACGTPVLASDLPVLHEVGGAAATYARVGDVADWVAHALRLLAERERNPAAWEARQEVCRQHGKRFRWQEHARLTANIYRNVLASFGQRSVTSRQLAGPEA